MHVSDVQFDLLGRGELPSQDADVALAHIAQCSQCAIRQGDFAATEDEIESSLRLLDSPVAKADVGAIIRRAKRGRTATLWRIAAGIAFLATAGAAAAMPGSPIRAWINRGSVERPTVSPPPAPQPVSREMVAAPVAGISIEASDSITLIFDADQSQGRIRVTFGTGSELRVSAAGGGASFEVRSEGLRVRNRGSSASYEVIIPATARSVGIRVADRWVFRKRDGLVAKAPLPEQDESYVVELTATRP